MIHLSPIALTLYYCIIALLFPLLIEILTPFKLQSLSQASRGLCQYCGHPMSLHSHRCLACGSLSAFVEKNGSTRRKARLH